MDLSLLVEDISYAFFELKAEHSLLRTSTLLRTLPLTLLSENKPIAVLFLRDQGLIKPKLNGSDQYSVNALLST